MPGEYPTKDVKAARAWSFRSAAWRRPSSRRDVHEGNGQVVSSSVRSVARGLGSQVLSSQRRLLTLMPAPAGRERPAAGLSGSALHAASATGLQPTRRTARRSTPSAHRICAAGLARSGMSGLSSARLAARTLRQPRLADAARRRPANALDGTDAAVARAARARIAAQMQAQRISLLAG